MRELITTLMICMLIAGLVFAILVYLTGCAQVPETQTDVFLTCAPTELSEQSAPSTPSTTPIETQAQVFPTIAIEITEPDPIILDYNVNWYSDYRVCITKTETELIGGYSFDKNFLAKLLALEARGMTWEGKVYTCSAILNLCDLHSRSLWSMGHDTEVFTGAEYVDNMKPTNNIYEVVEYVLGGGRVEEICYFRTKRYHNFGTPVCEVNGHYFSKN